jgi:uncharacterized phage protein (TIGR02218 family)
MHLKPETVKYNQTIINRFSKTCRTNFGDSKCTVDKNLYSGLYRIKEIFKESFSILNMDRENGYYKGGIVVFEGTKFSSKIVNNFDNLITLENIIPTYAEHVETVRLISGCDKNFITCCNKFNNALNFRGEPLIPESNFINTNLE